MDNNANIKAVITADDKASSVLKGFGDNVSSTAGKIGSALKVAAEGLAIAGGAAIAFGAASVKAFSESENIQAQLNAVLKSTNDVSKLTIQDLNDQSHALQGLTKYSDEQVGSAQALLLTFTSLSGGTVQQATGVVLDMATALNEDLKSASIQVGKALQDPVLGITALRRVGVNFSDDQKKVIQNLVDTGQTAAAQQLIIKELNKEFGGSAEAAGNTFSGSMAKIKNSLNDVQEKIGQVIVERLSPFISKSLEAISSIDWEKVIDKTIVAIKNFYRELDNLYQRVEKIAEKVYFYLEPSFLALWHTIQDKVLPMLLRLWHEVIEPMVPVVGTILVVAIGLAVDAFNALLTAVVAVINWMLDHKWIVEAVAGSFGVLAASMVFGAIVTTFNAAMDSAIITMETIRLVTIPNLVASLGTLGASFSIPAAAAVAASITIINAANAAKAAWDNAANAAVNKGNSDLAVIAQLQNTIRTGGPDAAARARTVLNKYQTTGQFAEGTNFAPGGPAIVGERGPELVNLPRGSQVIPNNKLPGGNITINIQPGMMMASDIEARKMAKVIFDHLKDYAGSKNMTVADMMS